MKEWAWRRNDQMHAAQVPAILQRAQRAAAHLNVLNALLGQARGAPPFAEPTLSEIHAHAHVPNPLRGSHISPEITITWRQLPFPITAFELPPYSARARCKMIMMRQVDNLKLEHEPVVSCAFGQLPVEQHVRPKRHGGHHDSPRPSTSGPVTSSLSPVMRVYINSTSSIVDSK
jgi:hypothetical protein